jgi:hypothetical protein
MLISSSVQELDALVKHSKLHGLTQQDDLNIALGHRN